MDRTVPAGVALSLDLIEWIVGKKMTKAQRANASSVLGALNAYGEQFGLSQPHRLAQFLPQILHESGAFRYDREVWGPTPAQKRYDTRTDLGNTPAADGDGFLFRGRTGIQITGRSNTRAFRDWCRRLMAGTSLGVPDFEKSPDAMLTDPWEGLGPLWYWDTRKLNRYADQGDIEMITKRINGGLNGYQDRLEWYAATALVLLGYGRNEVAKFQKEFGEEVDDIAGPRTRAAMHKALVAMTDQVFQARDVQAGPVVEEKKVEKSVVPVKVDQEVRQKTNWLTMIFGAGGVGSAALAWLKDADPLTVGIVAAAGLVAGVLTLVAGQWIVRRIKVIRKEWETA